MLVTRHIPVTKQIFDFTATLILSSANAFNLDQSKILLFGKELTVLPKQQRSNLSSYLSAGMLVIDL